MQESWQKALEEFINSVKAHFGEQINSIILFGSRIRREALPSSDIDLLMVLDNSADIKKIEDEAAEIASKTSLKHDVVISLVYVHKKSFEQRNEPLLINIRREGSKVA